MPGPSPKPASRRRRANKPVSYGAATPVILPAARDHDRALGFDAHPLVASLWATLHESCESRFYSAADWERARMELWYADQVMRSGCPTAAAWGVVQHGLNELLISPAIKRRCAIELKPPGPDADEVAAVSMMSQYKSKLKPVQPLS